MFDVSFSELMLIGVIALIVIGPERLPKVARTVGHLLGRAQRYVNDVKSDIQREIDLKEIGDIKGQMEDAARSVKASMEETQASISQPLDEAKKALQDAQSLVSTTPSPTEPSPAATSPLPAAGETSAPTSADVQTVVGTPTTAGAPAIPAPVAVPATPAPVAVPATPAPAAVPAAPPAPAATQPDSHTEKPA